MLRRGAAVLVLFGLARQAFNRAGWERRAPQTGSPLELTAIHDTEESAVEPAVEPLPAEEAWGVGAMEIRFFIYEQEEYLLPDGCAVGDMAPGIQPFFMKKLRNHASRVLRPSDADLFIVPYDMEHSYAIGSCDNMTHLARVNRLLDTLVESPWYEAKKGSNHFWAVLDYRFWAPLEFSSPPSDTYRRAASFYPPNRRGILEEMIIGRYTAPPFTPSHTAPAPELPVLAAAASEGSSARRTEELQVAVTKKEFSWLKPSSSESWRCPVVMPTLTPAGLLRNDTYEDWQKRKRFAIFRGKHKRCYTQRGQDIFNATQQLQDFLPFSTFSSERPRTQVAYAKELRSSKFCIIFGCDDPQTNRFTEAVAAGCIPVVVDDDFRLVMAPFSRQLNYDTFSITIPEQAWVQDPVAASRVLYAMHEGILERLYTGLMAAKRDLIWRHPSSNVADLTLQTIVQECLH